jgi:hypothetical protein
MHNRQLSRAVTRLTVATTGVPNIFACPLWIGLRDDWWNIHWISYRSSDHVGMTYVCLLMKTQDSRRRTRSSGGSCRAQGRTTVPRAFPAIIERFGKRLGPAKPVVQNLNRTHNRRPRSSFRKLFSSSPRAPPSKLVPNSSPDSLSTAHRPCTTPIRASAASAELLGVTYAFHGHGIIISRRAGERPQNFVLLTVHRP